MHLSVQLPEFVWLPVDIGSAVPHSIWAEGRVPNVNFWAEFPGGDGKSWHVCIYGPRNGEIVERLPGLDEEEPA